MTSAPTITGEDLLQRIGTAQVIVIGDLMLDRAVFGSVARISPEAPIPVLEMVREETRIGGAGNVVANLHALGAQAAAAGMVGDDAEGEEIARLVAELAPSGAILWRQEGRPSTVKTRYWGAGQQLLRVDREHRSTLSEPGVASILDWLDEKMATTRAIVLSDYAKGALPPALVEPVIARARAAGRPVLVDPKGRDYGRYRGATLLTPNRRELGEVTGVPVSDDGAVEQAAQALRISAGVDAVLATLGSDGMLLVDATGMTRIAGVRREVFDVVGAGDTVIATLAASMAAGASLAEAARLANLAGSIAVTRIGTTPVSRADLAQALSPASAKVADLERAVAVVSEERRKGWRIGFTNGCFDLLHAGHVDYLHAAKARCDFLIVGLNDDASVARLKGPGRPTNRLEDRARVLAALADVDLVVPFAEDTPLEVIRALRPDLLVKGSDYRPDEVVGAKEVASWGGELYLAELTPGLSTTALLERDRGS
ncbi:MAG TPA: D-glycero-beta-D-manno-heptose-7-phosphate kinase [Geminicoccus sp.]|jgi:D-beta-D-heptose 7-phosphate kinase/D-beta-D-heptose 1-phosphate adenosyltransferase|uniref:D-glycero-beta-D-manno-heptose-7-phosphate kinase n=1 Tax=Geminicoccus sp. TaxID=2024832 RepID=UPI002E2F1453|nr:D-glycero-beta-D-manno-heptose-7-phosphate kinase [Geminicoccus sp.]HEX2528383.1 D-glycero-beta-D-manno-heptose-7-phosphate kinase [Geminicoccus sp.]